MLLRYFGLLISFELLACVHMITCLFFMHATYHITVAYKTGTLPHFLQFISSYMLLCHVNYNLSCTFLVIIIA